jgi:hypothetical protein
VITFVIFAGGEGEEEEEEESRHYLLREKLSCQNSD